MSDSEREEVPRRRYKAPWSKGGHEHDPTLPYGPKVYLARKKKPDPWWVIAIEVSCRRAFGALTFMEHFEQ